MQNTITLAVKDTPAMSAYVSTPDGQGPFPAIIVFQEAFGVNHHIRNITDRFAAEGYVAIAPELYHRTAPAGFEVPYTDFSKIAPHTQAISNDTFIDDTRAVYEWLQTQDNVQKDKIAAIGFCMGGRVSFVANSEFPLSAAVSFYGGAMQHITDRAARLNGPQLLFWGGKDQHIKPEHVQAVVTALRESGKDFINVEISYADHGFFCDERAAYNPKAAREAWGMVKEFLKNNLS